MLLRPRALPTGFIAPCLPRSAAQPPSGDGWLHEIKRRLNEAGEWSRFRSGQNAGKKAGRRALARGGYAGHPASIAARARGFYLARDAVGELPGVAPRHALNVRRVGKARPACSGSARCRN
jgi:hypothetical protein